MTKQYNGERIDISTIQNGVKMSYHLPETLKDEAKTHLLVVFNVYHDRAGTFTGYRLERETEIGRRYDLLAADIKRVVSKHCVLKPSPKSTGVNVFDEVLKRLEQTICTEVTYDKIDNGMNFRGSYKDIRFDFNIYVGADGQLNRKAKKKNCVWMKPSEPPAAVKTAVDEVIQWVKRVEANGGRKAVIGSVSLAEQMGELELRR
jgi:hypothetical protein